MPVTIRLLRNYFLNEQMFTFSQEHTSKTHGCWETQSVEHIMARVNIGELLGDRWGQVCVGSLWKQGQRL